VGNDFLNPKEKLCWSSASQKNRKGKEMSVKGFITLNLDYTFTQDLDLLLPLGDQPQYKLSITSS
jgi:hypothetical protein